jgi:hypothetical protein
MYGIRRAAATAMGRLADNNAVPAERLIAEFLPPGRALRGPLRQGIAGRLPHVAPALMLC